MISHGARYRILDEPSFLKIRQYHRHLFLEVQLVHPTPLECQQFLWIKRGGCFVDSLERKVAYRIIEREMLGAVVERPTQQQQVIEYGVGQEACFAIEIDDDRIERLRSGLEMSTLGNPVSELEQGRKVFLLEVLIQFSFAEFGCTAGFGNVGQVRIDREGIAQALCNKNLAWCVRQVLDGSHNMGDFEIVVVDDTC